VPGCKRVIWPRMPNAECHSTALLSAGGVNGYSGNDIGRRQQANHAGLLLGLGNPLQPRSCVRWPVFSTTARPRDQGNLITASHGCFSSALFIHSVHGLVSQNIFLAPIDDATKLFRLDESIKGFLRVPLRYNKV